MATSRTGTTRWLNLRARLIRTRPHICHWCQRALNPKAAPLDDGAIQIDHLLPYSRHAELQYDEDNCVLSCRPCNRSKSNGAAPGLPASAGVDEHGIRILDPRVVCTVHRPIRATCPHSGALR